MTNRAFQHTAKLFGLFAILMLIISFSSTTTASAASQRWCKSPPKHWKIILYQGKQKRKTMKSFHLGRYNIIPVKFGPFRGEFGKLFQFWVSDTRRNCLAAVLEAGSYDFLTRYAREEGYIRRGQSVYHIRDYRGRGRHEILMFTTNKPSYGAFKSVLKRALR